VRLIYLLHRQPRRTLRHSIPALANGRSIQDTTNRRSRHNRPAEALIDPSLFYKTVQISNLARDVARDLDRELLLVLDRDPEVLDGDRRPLQCMIRDLMQFRGDPLAFKGGFFFMILVTVNVRLEHVVYYCIVICKRKVCMMLLHGPGAWLGSLEGSDDPALPVLMIIIIIIIIIIIKVREKAQATLTYNFLQRASSLGGVKWSFPWGHTRRPPPMLASLKHIRLPSYLHSPPLASQVNNHTKANPGEENIF
jgi:hypothetical protein